MLENVPLLIAFGAGLLSFLSPCVLPLMPVYFASLCGPEILDPGASRIRLPVFLHSLSFVAGVSLVFVLLGVVAGWVGLTLSHRLAFRPVVGILLIVFGLYMLVALKVPWLNYERRLKPSRLTATGYLRSFLTGGISSLAMTPCVSPILGGILSLAADSAKVWSGAYLLAVYSLGVGLPFLAAGVAFDAVTPWLKRFRRYATVIYVFSSLLLITMGILVLANRLVWF